MSKYSRKNTISDETKEDALKTARGTQRPGQTKEQTRLIAQGIQKGIDLYKKQQKAKARELDKKLKQISSGQQNSVSIDESAELKAGNTGNKMPWFLLVISWIGFIAYLLFTQLSVK